MTRISIEEVKHVAHLARLSVTEEEVQAFKQQLDQMITYAELLDECDVEGVEPTSHVLPIKNVMREDVTSKSLTQEDVLKNAPDKKDGQFRVPSILE